jgi:hypothetical protein
MDDPATPEPADDPPTEVEPDGPRPDETPDETARRQEDERRAMIDGVGDGAG